MKIEKEKMLAGELYDATDAQLIFGVLVISFAAASAGGIMRDLLLGAVPPVA
jgi:uncharacterized membrane protein YeiH